jgi:murein DD-endopeptidase MepM/ murein hydrolase activator NlpD
MPVGTPVLAVADGVISNVLTDKSYGEVVVLKADKYEIWYCHLSVKGVKKGQKVVFSVKIGSAGQGLKGLKSPPSRASHGPRAG